MYAAEKFIFEMIHICILPFSHATAFKALNIHPRVSAAYCMANDLQFDVSDPYFESMSPSDFGEVFRLVQYLRGKLLIGWTDETLDVAEMYSHIQMPLILEQESVNPDGSKAQKIHVLPYEQAMRIIRHVHAHQLLKPASGA
jgi:hypothetical protein